MGGRIPRKKLKFLTSEAAIALRHRCSTTAASWISRTAAEGASMPGGWRCDGIKHVAEMEVEDAVNAAVAFAVEASVLERDV